MIRPLAFSLTLLFMLSALLAGDAAALPAPASAPDSFGGGGGGGANHIAVTLEAETPRPAPGGAVTLAFAMTPAPGWHGYWKNGGDAGLGMEVAWTLPPGVRIGPLDYPVPDTLVIAGLMNHVYERPYALLADLRIDRSLAPGTRLPIVADARWLACTDRICVPEQGRFTLTLTVGDGRIERDERARFDGFRAALARPLGSEARYAISGSDIIFGIPLPAAMRLDRPHLFVANPNTVQAAAPQRWGRAGDLLTVTTRADPALAASTASGAPIEALLRLGDGSGVAFRALPGAVAPQPALAGTDMAGNGGEDTAAHSPVGIAAALLAAVLGGLLLNIMPCVFPILSLKALALARAGGASDVQARREGIAYAAGAVATALALGGVLLGLRAAGDSVGWAFQLQNPPIVLALLLLTAAIAAQLAGLFTLPTLGGAGTARPGAAGAFWTGALAAFVATPCSGPFLGAALGATLVLPPPVALAIFAGLGLGLALPFLAIGFIPALRARLPRPGPWMARAQRLLAVPMALTALALLWLYARQTRGAGLALALAAVLLLLAMLAWAGARQRRGARLGAALVPTLILAIAMVTGTALVPVRAPALANQADAFSEARLVAARNTGSPVFVYFTADWCVTCKANEAAAINRASTQAAFREHRVVTLVGDWTNGDPTITRFLARHGRNSVPLYLWYPPESKGEPTILPQILTPALLAARARQR